jgi:hypothetical protein
MIDTTVAGTMREFARKCPRLNRAIAKRRYLLPKTREDDYIGQDFCDNHFRNMLMQWALGSFSSRNSAAVEVLNLVAGLKYDRPLLYLELELAEKLLETDLPEDFTTEEVHWPWPSFRVMLPKGLIGAPAFDGKPMHALYLDLTLWERGTELALAREYAVELNGLLGNIGSVEELSRPSVQEAASGFYLSALSDYQKPGFMPDIASCLASWADWKLRDMITSTGHNLEGTVKEEINHKFLERLRFVALNLLLFLSQEPITVFPDNWLRKPKTEGKREHLIPGLLPARFVGDCMPKFRANPSIVTKNATPSGKTHAAHWVRGYWKRVVYGKGRALRRRQWIMPYRTFGPPGEMKG